MIYKTNLMLLEFIFLSFLFLFLNCKNLIPNLKGLFDDILVFILEFHFLCKRQRECIWAKGEMEKDGGR